MLQSQVEQARPKTSPGGQSVRSAGISPAAAPALDTRKSRPHNHPEVRTDRTTSGTLCERTAGRLASVGNSVLRSRGLEVRAKAQKCETCLKLPQTSPRRELLKRIKTITILSKARSSKTTDCELPTPSESSSTLFSFIVVQVPTSFSQLPTRAPVGKNNDIRQLLSILHQKTKQIL